MNSDTISKFRLFGKAGKIVMTVLAVIAAIITISCCIAAAFVAALPDNALTVRVVENTELRFNAESFDTLWNIIGGSFSYSGESSPEYMLGEGAGKVTPPEDQQFKTELKLFNRSYDSAEIHSDGNTKVMQAEAPRPNITQAILRKCLFSPRCLQRPQPLRFGCSEGCFPCSPSASLRSAMKLWPRCAALAFHFFRLPFLLLPPKRCWRAFSPQEKAPMSAFSGAF